MMLTSVSVGLVEACPRSSVFADVWGFTHPIGGEWYTRAVFTGLSSVGEFKFLSCAQGPCEFLSLVVCSYPLPISLLGSLFSYLFLKALYI